MQNSENEEGRIARGDVAKVFTADHQLARKIIFSPDLICLE